MRSSAPHHSFAATPRFGGAALVALAVLANVACVCGAPAPAAPSARLVAEETRQGDPHACCRHPQTPGERPHSPAPAAPGHDSPDECPHCGNGTLAVERPERNDGRSLEPLHAGLAPDAALTSVPADLACQLLPKIAATPPASLPPSPTLLSLRCALNL